MSLRTRLALIFVVATLVPLGATVWVVNILLDQSLRPADQLSGLSLSVEKLGREFYQQSRDRLRSDIAAGRIKPLHYAGGVPRQGTPQQAMPQQVDDFWQSRDSDRFALSGMGGSELLYMRRTGNGVDVFDLPLGVRMEDISREYGDARQTVARDLRRGFLLTWGLLAAAIWAIAMIVVWAVATRFSRPIVNLTGALKSLASGNFRIRVPNERLDEIGLATEAFNRTAAQLEQNRDRLVYLTQLASWQTLARKMAHEVKNSLTPIRLTVEEMVARGADHEAASIVVDEIESLERRIRAFSEFSSEPPVCPEPLDIGALVEERVAFLKSAHPEVRYSIEKAALTPDAMADPDLVKGILVNLLENAADAAGAGGEILARITPLEDRVSVEIHDSGPGLSDLARESLFQPSISFKKGGMGLGLSIARKSALLCSGDILAITGELGGAGFRVMLPAANMVTRASVSVTEVPAPQLTIPTHGTAANPGR
jgi:signal transduction histidine kinase